MQDVYMDTHTLTHNTHACRARATWVIPYALRMIPTRQTPHHTKLHLHSSQQRRQLDTYGASTVHLGGTREFQGVTDAVPLVGLVLPNTCPSHHARVCLCHVYVQSTVCSDWWCRTCKSAGGVWGRRPAGHAGEPVEHGWATGVAMTEEVLGRRWDMPPVTSQESELAQQVAFRDVWTSGSHFCCYV